MNPEWMPFIPDDTDQENFLILDVCPQGKDEAALIMYDKRPHTKKPWRLAYRRSDYFFETREALERYFAFRGLSRVSL